MASADSAGLLRTLLQDEKISVPCRKAAAILGIASAFTMLIVAIMTPKMATGSESLSSGMAHCNRYWRFSYAFDVVEIKEMPPDVSTQLHAVDGPENGLFLSSNCSSPWTDHVFKGEQHISIMKFGKRDKYLLPGETHSPGKAFALFDAMTHKEKIHFVNTTLRGYLPFLVGANPWKELSFMDSFTGHYVTTLIMSTVATGGALLAYVALLRGRIVSAMDKSVLKYFIWASIGGSLGGAGYIDNQCGFRQPISGFFLGICGGFCVMLCNLWLQFIMLEKVSGMAHNSPEHAARLKRMSVLLYVEKIAMLAFGMCFITMLFGLPQLVMQIIWFNVAASNACLGISDLWFSYLAIKTYLEPLTAVKESLKALHLQDEASEATAKQLRTAYRMAALNLAASIVAVISTSFSYLVVVVYCSMIAFGAELHIYSAANNYNPWRVLFFDSVLNDICTIVFTDLLFLNSSSAKMHRMAWAIGQVGQQAAALRQQDEEEQARLHEALKALSSAENPAVKKHMTELELELRCASLAAFETDDDAAADKAFQRIQAVAEEEMRRLSKLADTLIELYSRATARYDFILAIQSSGDGIVQHVPQSMRNGCDFEDNAPLLKYLFAKIVLVAPEVNRCLSDLMAAFNKASSVDDLGLDVHEFPFSLGASSSERPRATMIRGPVKTQARCWHKIRSPEDYGLESFPQAAHLLDIERCQIRFQDPYELAIFYHYLCNAKDSLRIVRVKNRFLEKEPIFGYRDILVNVECEGLVTEVQLTLTNLAELKRVMHPVYKILRSTDHQEVVGEQCFCKIDNMDVVGAMGVSVRQGADWRFGVYLGPGGLQAALAGWAGFSEVERPCVPESPRTPRDNQGLFARSRMSIRNNAESSMQVQPLKVVPIDPV